MGRSLAEPFTVAEAREAGLEWEQSQARERRRLDRGIYGPASLGAGPLVTLAATRRRLPPNAVFSGLTAAWLHGLDVLPCSPFQVTLPIGCGVSARAGLAVRRDAFDESEVILRQGYRCTSVVRTLADVSQRLTVVEAVVVADMALQAGLIRSEELVRALDPLTGRKGVKRFRRVVGLAEVGAESPIETRLRLLLVLARLPRPQLQTEFFDDDGQFIARVDLYYPAQRLVIEYDGEWHSDNLVADDRRHNRLADAGYRVLRFTAADVRNAPHAVIAQVRSFLRRHA